MPENNPKKILIIAYPFPPQGGVGVQRTLKLVKFLPRFNFKTYVVTTKSTKLPDIDETLLSEIPNSCTVYRTRDINLLAPFIKKEKGTAKGPTSSILNRILVWIYKRFTSFFLRPDRHIFWRPFAIRKALQVIKEENIDLIYVTAEPFTDFLVGNSLKKKTGLPYVIDFRDLWAGYISNPAPTKLHLKIDQHFERRSVELADLIITNSDMIKQELIRRHGFAENKCQVIPNGFDPDDFKDIKIKPAQHDKFIIRHIGTLGEARNFSPVIKLFEKALENNDLKNKIKIELIGRLSVQNQLSIKESKIAENIEIRQFLPHKQALEEAANADALLFYHEKLPFTEMHVPAKLYEYFALKRPVIGISDAKSAATLTMNQTQVGIAIDTDHTDAAEKLTDFLNQLCSGSYTYKPNEMEIEKYDRARQAQRFAEVFDELLTSK